MFHRRDKIIKDLKEKNQTFYATSNEVRRKKDVEMICTLFGDTIEKRELPKSILACKPEKNQQWRKNLIVTKKNKKWSEIEYIFYQEVHKPICPIPEHIEIPKDEENVVCETEIITIPEHIEILEDEENVICETEIITIPEPIIILKDEANVICETAIFTIPKPIEAEIPKIDLKNANTTTDSNQVTKIKPLNWFANFLYGVYILYKENAFSKITSLDLLILCYLLVNANSFNKKPIEYRKPDYVSDKKPHFSYKMLKYLIYSLLVGSAGLVICIGILILKLN